MRLKRSQSATLLDGRIAENASAQQIDFVGWIFDNVSVEPGSKVLELCCGTGSQTLRLLDLVGEMGQVIALDISARALERLIAKVPEKQQSRLTLIGASIDNLRHALEKSGLEPPCFDLVFCAYGLYHSANTTETLQEIKRLLRPGGRIVIVGPFGPNNTPLFGLLERGGVIIPHVGAKRASVDFMFKEVIPWAAEHFRTISIDTVVNHIAWNRAANVLGYWQNTTFYDPERLSAIERLVNEHFGRHPEFVNEKWIMIMEAANVRT